jgi:glutathione S-transferase
MNLILYYAPLTCALVPFIALTEAGAEFDVRVVDYRRGDHITPEYLALNPKHKVPLLLINGEPLTENVAILVWISRHYPQSHLLPAGTLEECKAISFLAWCASGIHPTLTPNALPHLYCDLPGSEDSVRSCAQRLLKANYSIAEYLISGRNWFFNAFSLADAYFFWCFRRGLQFKIDLSDFPNCHSHFKRMSNRPSVQKLLAYETEALENLERMHTK